jgi:23S rRNA (cytidine1920-2'-O)/16S rRNA (cytidine1409-2'-O)-methyltransferase
LSRQRLDVELVRRGLASSRAQAKRLIVTQQVMVIGGGAARPSSVVASETRIEVIGSRRQWVSRGAEKLLAALEAFPVEVSGKRVLDVGASTGGFTEVALDSGAAQVVALDVGRGQLHPRLRSDPRVVTLEQTNIRQVGPEDLGGRFPVIVVDVSFISLRTISLSLAEMAEHGSDLIALVKPQFEVGRQNLARGGIVRDADARARAVTAVLASLNQAGFGPLGLIRSPIEGGDGNVEYLAWLRKGERGTVLEIPA